MEFVSWHGKPDQAKRGCSLGNRRVFLRADPRANIDGVWLAENNRWYVGELSLEPLPLQDWQATQVSYHLHHQSHHSNAITGGSVAKHLMLDPLHPRAYIWFQGTGFVPESEIRFQCRWRVSAALTTGHRQQPDWKDCERQWEVLQHSGETLIARPLSEGLEALALHASKPYKRMNWVAPNLLIAEGVVTVESNGCFEYWVCIELNAQDSGSYPSPPHPITAIHEGANHPESAHLVSVKVPHTVPSESLRKAVYWGEACSRRVFHKYRADDRYQGFTNDPPGNTIVTRDAAWYLFGSDYFAPDYSRSLLRLLCENALYSSGKAAEFVRISPEALSRDDYNLNINDATPLLLLGIAHHLHLHKESLETQELAPLLLNSARRLGDWILRQRNTEGLIYCTGSGTNVWGIAGWRNIIPGYNLTGAVTELNALCVAALRACAGLHRESGESAEADRFAREALALDRAMSQLVDPNTGYFYLTKVNGRANSQLAVDLAFPALFRAGDEEARVRTVLRLLEPDFQCPQGVLTLSRDDEAFHPRFGWGLMGGTWPNATAWVATAIASLDRERAWELAERLASTLVPKEEFPCGVSVPGQFPEWFAPDNNESAGMSLSPWMPATFVWLVLEGIPAGRVLFTE